ncbi:MAG: heavy-metal-associated domain-containing protein, partial [Opitutaceae bacterium]|nr:heavy-metal-associated domain-containing protein [Opitutaceae bacterium]
MSQTTIKIAGLKCPGCSGRLKRAIAAIPGVNQAEVILETGLLTVDYDETGLKDAAATFAETI